MPKMVFQIQLKHIQAYDDFSTKCHFDIWIVYYAFLSYIGAKLHTIVWSAIYPIEYESSNVPQYHKIPYLLNYFLFYRIKQICFKYVKTFL